MSPRIKELVDQANGPNPFFGTLKNQMSLLGDDAVEKFALLIVEEMYVFMCDATDNDKPWPTFKEVKEHFGVEE